MKTYYGVTGNATIYEVEAEDMYDAADAANKACPTFECNVSVFEHRAEAQILSEEILKGIQADEDAETERRNRLWP